VITTANTESTEKNSVFSVPSVVNVNVVNVNVVNVNVVNVNVVNVNVVNDKL
jgi:hypothetical protein